MGNVFRFPKRPEMLQLAELDADSFKVSIGPPRLTPPGVLGWLWLATPAHVPCPVLAAPAYRWVVYSPFSPLPCWSSLLALYSSMWHQRTGPLCEPSGV